MGRQINFYMNKIVENEFINKIFCDGYSIVVEYLERKKIITYKSIAELKLDWSRSYIYNRNHGKIVKKWKNYVDSSLSPVIEFSRTIVIPDRLEIVRGRLWVQTYYYDSRDAMIKQNSDVIKEFDTLTRWIKKKVPFQETEVNYFHKYKEYINDDILQIKQQGYKLL